MEEKLINLLIELRKYYKDSPDQDKVGLIFIVADANISKVSSTMLGNHKLIVKAMSEQFKKKDELKRVLFAIFGSYLTEHPEDKEIFLKGLDLVSNGPNQS